MPITYRPIEADEVPAFRDALVLAFGGQLESEEDRDPGRFLDLIPLDRTLAAVDGDEIVGTLAAYPLSLTLPGRSAIAAAGTTMVTVRPTHRRRGILTELMRRHLDDVNLRGEAVAALWASESAIYPRFGFGRATDHHHATWNGRQVRIEADPSIPIGLIGAERAAAVLPPIYERFRLGRAGMFARRVVDWRHRVLWDPPDARGGASALRFAVAGAVDDPAGYAIFRHREEWSDLGIPGGTIDVREVVGTDDARGALWRFLSSIDLFPNVKHWNLPVDDPLVRRIDDVRRITRSVLDGLWLRLVDPARALASRSYETDGSVRFHLVDAFVPDRTGSYELTVDGGAATVSPTPLEPELTLTIGELSGLFLGNGGAIAAFGAGRIDGAPDAVVRLERIMRTSIAPWCQQVF